VHPTKLTAKICADVIKQLEHDTGSLATLTVLTPRLFERRVSYFLLFEIIVIKFPADPEFNASTLAGMYDVR
jgi:hypothetical protein